MKTWKDLIECAVCTDFMIGPGRAPQVSQSFKSNNVLSLQICPICYNSCCSRCVLRQNRVAQQQMEVISFFIVFVRANQTLPPKCPISNCTNLGAYRASQKKVGF